MIQRMGRLNRRGEGTGLWVVRGVDSPLPYLAEDLEQTRRWVAVLRSYTRGSVPVRPDQSLGGSGAFRRGVPAARGADRSGGGSAGSHPRGRDHDTCFTEGGCRSSSQRLARAKGLSSCPRGARPLPPCCNELEQSRLGSGSPSRGDRVRRLYRGCVAVKDLSLEAVDANAVAVSGFHALTCALWQFECCLNLRKSFRHRRFGLVYCRHVWVRGSLYDGCRPVLENLSRKAHR